MLTERQKLFISYLKVMDIPKPAIAIIILNLPTDQALEEMVEFCKKHHPDISPDLLLPMSYEICSKYSMTED